MGNQTAMNLKELAHKLNLSPTTVAARARYDVHSPAYSLGDVVDSTVNPRLVSCQGVSVRLLTFAESSCYTRGMSMARLKKPLNLAIDPALLARLDAWIARQDVSPSKTAVIESAIREFLDARRPKR